MANSFEDHEWAFAGGQLHALAHTFLPQRTVCGSTALGNAHMIPQEMQEDWVTVHRCAACESQFDPYPTVKRATLFDGVADSFQTEAELNGHRPAQGRML